MVKNERLIQADRYDFQSEAEREFPRMVIVGVSFACNAKCSHCIYAMFPKTKEEMQGADNKKVFMDLNTFKKIADECAGHKHSLLRLVGFGEPMLNPSFFEMVEYGKRVGCNVGIITNGSLLDEKSCNRLLDAGIDAVDISVDAYKKETYEKIRAGLDFDKLEENVKRFVDMRNKKSKNTFIFCSIVEQTEVMEELNDALKYWGGITDKVVSRKFLTFGLFKKEHNREPYYTKRVPCFLLFDRINVDLNGIIRQCGYDSFGETSFGNVNDSAAAIYDAWHSEKLNDIRKKHFAGKFEETGLCSKCQDWPFHSWEKNYIKDSFDKRKKI